MTAFPQAKSLTPNELASKVAVETEEPMQELLMLFILAVVVSILFNWGSPKFYASSIGSRFGSSYAGHTLATAIVFAAVIWVAAFMLSFVDGDAGRVLP